MQLVIKLISQRDLRAARCGLLLLALVAGPAMAATISEKEIQLSGGASVLVQIHPAAGKELLLMLPSEYGIVDETKKLANSLAASGIEVWRADLLAAHFLPPLSSSINKVPAADVARVIEQAVQSTGKRVIVFADGRGAVLALRGLRFWQRTAKKHKTVKLIGAVLLSPSLYVETPPPGKPAQYLPITEKTTINIVILQPQMSPWYWWRDRLQIKLAHSGSRCEVRVLEGVRDRFYFRPDATAIESTRSKKLPHILLESIKALAQMKRSNK